MIQNGTNCNNNCIKGQRQIRRLYSYILKKIPPVPHTFEKNSIYVRIVKIIYMFNRNNMDIGCMLRKVAKGSYQSLKWGPEDPVPPQHRSEREFPFPVIPGNTSLKFPFPSRSREKEVLAGN